MSSLTFHCALGLALSCAAAGSLRAAPVLGNLTIPATDRAVPVSLNSWQASSFKLAETASPWRLSSITLRLAQDVPNTSFTVRIVNEAAFRPDLSSPVAAFHLPALITGATAPAPGSSATPVLFPAADSPDPVLQPGKTYWLVVGITQPDQNFTPATGLYYWSYATTSAADPGTAPGWQFGTATASAGTLGSNWSPDPTTPFTFSIDATPDIPAVTLASWRLTHPGGPEDPTAFLTDDSDHDGKNGLLEFAFNGSPSQSDSAGPALFTDSTGRPGLEFTRWTRAPEIRYDIQSSDNLINWSTPPADAIATTVQLLENGTERVRLTWINPGPRRFLRVSVSRL